jgi:hypothetical protein
MAGKAKAFEEFESVHTVYLVCELTIEKIAGRMTQNG